MAKSTSKAPSGLTVTRNGATFTCSWKTGEKYTAQTFQYCIARSLNKSGSPIWPTKKVKGKTQIAWITKKVGAGTTATSISANGCAGVLFHVRGQAKNKNPSAFVQKGYGILPPNAPSVSMSVTNDYTSSFTWKTEYDNKTNRHFVRNQWQHALIVDSNTSDGNTIKAGWSSTGNTGAESSWTKEESGWDIKTGSRTRWVRVRAQGWAGLYSAWRYARRVYAVPTPATNVAATRSPFAGSGYAVVVEWNSPETQARPIDSINIEYAKTQPTVTVTYPEENEGTVTMDMSCPVTGVSWSSVVDAGGVAGKRSAAFTDFDDVPEDQCFYVTIANKHDNNVTRSTPVLADGGIAALAKPSAPSIESSTGVPGLYSVTVSSRGTAIDEAALAVYFRVSSEQNKATCIGIIPPGLATTNCIIPEVPEGDTFAFGVQAFVGNYTPMAAPSGSTTPTVFTPVMQMSSETVWGDEVPLPPQITAESAGENTIQVSWTWSWTDATQAELSWADHDDAWESTDEPQTYIVDSVNASRWRIAGLSVGTWYVRVRLIKPGADSASYSAYSETKVVKLSASPDIPSLLVSSGTIPKSGSVTCYWAYVSGDGTGQRQAQIFEAFPEYAPVDNPSGNPYENAYYERSGETEATYKYARSLDTSVVSGKTYYQATGETTYSANALASTESAQHLTLNAEDYGWNSGETHHLSVRVMSMSGEPSAGFSTPVPVTIADELSIDIASSSLIFVNVPSEQNLDDEVTAYRSVLSMTEFPLEFVVDGYAPGDRITCIIDRAESYKVDRPDESEYEGFIGETVLMKDYDTDHISITQDDLIGNMDDGAAYRVTIILNDAYGQNVQTSRIPIGSYTEVTDPVGNPQELGYYVLVSGSYILTTDTEVVEGTTYYTRDYTESFEVHWTHQAVMPSATIELDKENNVTMITPVMPESGYAEGDVADIYRLSADPPELIYAGAAFGTKYVDPYPAFGEFGGHRIVYRTVNGDYITEQNELAMVDYAASDDKAYKHDLFGIVIDFDGNQIVLPGNVSFSNSWSKDFTLTKYLGGAVQGDWNPAVERTMSAKTTISVEFNPENIEDIRRLAVYPGICHVRTPDGSSFAANIDVTEDREEKWTRRIAKVSLDITRCDPEGSDAMTYAEWMEEQEEQ